MKITTHISIIVFVILLLPQFAFAGFNFQNGKKLRADISVNEPEVVKTAFGILQSDYLRVFDAEMHQNPKQAKLLIGTIGLQSKAERNVEKNDLAALKQKREGFLI